MAGKPLFADFQLGRVLANELRRIHDEEEVSSLAFVVMPDHLHWLVQLKGKDLSAVMRALKSRSAIAINRMSGRQGAVWQAGYHDRAIREDEDVQHVARYVVANPLRAGLVGSLRDYPLWDAIWL